MMQYFFIGLILSTILALSACATQTEKDQDSNTYSVPVGSTLTLKQGITIPANLARRFFQYGQAMKESDTNPYYPHCSILMNTLTDHQRTIKPTVFEIYKVLDGEEVAQQHILYAQNFLASSGGPLIIGYTSYYYLRSADNPDVRSLECIQWDTPVTAEYLSINEIKNALGNYFDLQISD